MAVALPGRWTRYAARLLAALGGLLLFAYWWYVLPPRPRAALEGDDLHLDCFSPDGKTLLTTELTDGSSAGPIVLWDASTGRQRCVLAPNWPHMKWVEFSPDGRLLAALEGSVHNPANHLMLWDAATGAVRADLDAEPARFLAARFSPDGRFLVLQRWSPGPRKEGPLEFWEIDTGQVRATVDGIVGAPLTFAPDGRRFVVYHSDDRGVIRSVQLWALGEGPTYLTLLKQYAVSCDELACSPTLDRFASAEYPPGRERDVEIKVHDLATSSLLASTTARAPEYRIEYLRFSPDGQFLLMRGRGWTDQSGPTIIWDVNRGLRVRRTCVADPVLSPDGRWLLDRNQYGADLVEMAALRKRRTLQRQADVHVSPLRGGLLSYPEGAFSRDGKVVAITGLYRLCRTSAVNRFLSGQSSVPWEERLAGVARLWDVDTGTELMAWDGCSRCLLSPDGRTIATEDEEGHILLWDMPPRRPLLPILALTAASWAALLVLPFLARRWWRRRQPGGA